MALAIGEIPRAPSQIRPLGLERVPLEPHRIPDRRQRLIHFHNS